MDISALIKKLKDIKLEDLRSLNRSLIIDFLIKKSNIIINSIIIVVTLTICIRVYNNRRQEIKTALQEIPLLEQKIEAMNKFNQVDKELKEFIETIPDPVSESDLINIITDFASKYGIKVNSFSPSREQEGLLNSIISINISIIANSYKDLWLFFYEIEKSVYPIRINSLSVSSISQGNAGRPQGNPDSDKEVNINELTASIDVSSISYKKQ